MGRHTVKMATLPGVEYDEEDQSLYIDVPAYLAAGGPRPATDGVTVVFMVIYHTWKKNMPAYPVRLYHVRGEG